MRYLLVVLMLAPPMLAPLPAEAFKAVTTRDAFVALVAGERLTGDGIGLRVSPEGAISGRGFGFRVTGAWTWEDGLFRRTLNSAIRDFPRNCQTVAVEGDVVRFRADRGTGDVADLRLQ